MKLFVSRYKIIHLTRRNYFPHETNLFILRDILLLSKDANSTSKIGFRAIRTFKIGSEEEDDNETKYYDFEIELKNGDYIEFSFIEE